MNVVALNLRTFYWDLYPGGEEISIKSISGVEDGVGLTLVLEGYERFSHFLYCLDGEWVESRDGVIKVRFKDDTSTEAQHVTLKVKGILPNGTETKVYSITIGYYPSKLYELSGRTSPSWVIIQKSDLNLLGSRVEDWILEEIPEEDKFYARRTWGDILSQSKNEFEIAKILAKKIIDDLEPHRGIPSDEMNKLSPFKQYERVISGKDKVWCGNISIIYSYALNALGIPCRRIGMSHQVQSSGKGFHILLAEGHSTTEIFIKSIGKWVWLDPTFRVLGAYIGDFGPLNMIQFYILLNDKTLADNIHLVEYDPSEKKEKKVPLQESRSLNAILNYFKRDQTFRFYKRG